MRRKTLFNSMILAMGFLLISTFAFADTSSRSERRKKELDEMQERFKWWPSDAKPNPVKDLDRGGYWWWPDQPGEIRPWGNRGYVYVYKIIYDYKAQDDDVEAAVPAPPSPAIPEPKPSLLIKKILKNVKIYFDYNKADLRDDHASVLEMAVKTLQRNPEADILITGSCDARGSVEYNLKLGKRRGEAVKQFMLGRGIPEERIKIISRGKLDAVAPISDLVGMQKDRNAQFMIAEVEEVMLAYEGPPPDVNARAVEEGKYLVEAQEQVETAVQVSTKEYTIQKGDSLWKIAQQQMGSGHRWKYLYELNKDRIKDPNRLKAGQKILIPVE